MYLNIFCYNNFATSTTLVCVVLIYSISTICIINCLPTLSESESTAIKISAPKESELTVKSHNIPSKANNVPSDKDLASNTIGKKEPITLTTTTASNVKVQENCSEADANNNKTKCLEESGDSVESNDYVKSVFKKMTENRGMLMRTLYVSLGVTGIAVVYFVVRSVWLRRKHTKSRKYGVATQRGNHRDMEMEPLGDGDNEDDDDDYTVFEANGRKK
jgi:hypothetical protein